MNHPLCSTCRPSELSSWPYLVRTRPMPLSLMLLISKPPPSFAHAYTIWHQHHISKEAWRGNVASCCSRLSSLASNSSRPPAQQKQLERLLGLKASIAQRDARRCLATAQEAAPKPSIEFRTLMPYGLKDVLNKSPKCDERTLKLGKTLRRLQERLPTLLQRPLPPEMLSPKITLNLFPSTHPHLPSVSGRVAYSAALWTSPIAWGRVPLISNVRLEILSERMIKHASVSTSPHRTRAEKLVVRWRTVSKSRNASSATFARSLGDNESKDKTTDLLATSNKSDDVREFTGLFIFEFDSEGRVLTHTIEHVEEGGNWEQCVGAKVVGLTDWLLGGMKGNGSTTNSPCPVFFELASRPKTWQAAELGRISDKIKIS